jgi:hypothetical protein
MNEFQRVSNGQSMPADHRAEVHPKEIIRRALTRSVVLFHDYFFARRAGSDYLFLSRNKNKNRKEQLWAYSAI